MSIFKRPPDFVIGDPKSPYLKRWFIVPRNPWFNIYLHKFERSDDDRALHDHPWASLSIILKGGYYEVFPMDAANPGGATDIRPCSPGSIKFRKASDAHRVMLFYDMRGRDIPAWTIFITGPRVREWGFWCPQAWRHWREFTSGPNGETVGKGCEGLE